MNKLEIGNVVTDEHGVNLKVVAENNDMFFLVPFEIVGGYKEYAYNQIRAYDKHEPDYPLEKVVNYKGIASKV